MIVGCAQPLNRFEVKRVVNSALGDEVEVVEGEAVSEDSESIRVITIC